MLGVGRDLERRLSRGFEQQVVDHRFVLIGEVANCCRLTAPALACRHAGPWPRKISATSSAGRGKAVGRYAGGGSLLSSPGFLPGFFLAFLRGSDSRSSGLLMFAIMSVATRV